MNDSGTPSSHAPTFKDGVDFVLGGGLPAGRVTLLVGGPGAGKTLLASEFIVQGARHGRPGLIVSFDTSTERLLDDLRSLDLDVDGLIEDGLVAVHHVRGEALELPASGPFTLDGLMLQLESLLGTLGGARRLALDSMGSLLAAASEGGALRRELRRLFDWLSDRGVTVVVTAERAARQLTPFGVEEYLTDCVILLDYDVEERIATRRLRVLKRRGGMHSGDRHPFMITREGIRLVPLTASSLTYDAPSGRLSSGIRGLDGALEGEGFFRGSSILVSGTPGAGKSSIAAAFVDAACERGETALYYTFEESPRQIVRNMGAVGYDLERWIEKGSLHIQARRPSEIGLEHHLMDIDMALRTVAPDVVVLDPYTCLTSIDYLGTARSTMIRLVDTLKRHGTTTMYTALGSVTPEAPGPEHEQLVSSLMDTWLVLESRRRRGRLQRFLWVLKSRGMNHSRALHSVDVGDDGLLVGPPLDRPDDPAGTG